MAVSAIIRRGAFLSLVFACLAAAAMDGETMRCANIRLADGRVRIAGIAAPAASTPQGRKATDLLGALLHGAIECRQIDGSAVVDGFQQTDPRGRILAHCSVDGRDLGDMLVRAGVARPVSGN